MKKTTLTLTLLCCCAALALAGCSTNRQVKKEQAPAEQIACIPIEPQGLPLKPVLNPGGGKEAGPAAPVAAVADQKSGSDRFHPLSAIYFDFDSYVLDQQAREYLDKFFQSAKPEAGPFRVEGYCDERGDDEYNMALGERRSHAVEAYLETRGIDAKLLSSVSYGKEYPADPSHTESAWKLNRRVEIVKASAPKPGSKKRYGTEE